MKIRKGFVSNSSTSSFVCEICGESVAAHDSCSYSDIGFTECINGHLFCEEHLEDCDIETFKKEMIQYISEVNKEYLERNNDSDILDVAELEELNDTNSIKNLMIEYGYEYADGVPNSCCPICLFKASSMKDISKYLFKNYGVSRDTVFEEIKNVNKRRKKLYDFEYVNYVYKEFNLTEENLLKELKNQFGTYAEFQKHLTEKS